MRGDYIAETIIVIAFGFQLQPCSLPLVYFLWIQQIWVFERGMF
jgi:hypothetical protein